jgi:hypothetical protein
MDKWRTNGHHIFSEDGWTKDERTPYIFGGQTGGGQTGTAYFLRTDRQTPYIFGGLTDGHHIFLVDGRMDTIYFWRTIGGQTEDGGRQWFSRGWIVWIAWIAWIAKKVIYPNIDIHTRNTQVIYSDNAITDASYASRNVFEGQNSS